jgi:phage repressor protein C with HTH and peptisase S24 domain
MNKQFADQLLEGRVVQCRPRGRSMTPRLKSGQLITISPEIEDLHKGDIVFCKVRGKYFVHLLSAIQGERYQISNNHGHVNGWIGKNGIFGKVTAVGD